MLFSITLLVFLISTSATQPTTYASTPSNVQIVKTIDVSFAGHHGMPQFLVYNPSNGFVYVSDFGYNCEYQACGDQLDRGRVVIINSTSNEVVAKVAVGYLPSDIIYNPSNQEVYVANQINGTVSVLKGLKVVKTIGVGSLNPYNLVGGPVTPYNLVYNPSNKFVYVGDSGTNTVSVINGSKNAVVATITVGSGPFNLMYDPSNQEVYVANGASNTVSIIKGTVVVATMSVGKSPLFLAYDPANRDMYVTYSGSAFYTDRVAVINGTTNKVDAIVHLYSGAGAMRYDPANKNIYVTGYANQGGSNQENAFLFAVSSATNKIVANVSISDYFPVIQYLSYDPANKDMYFSVVDGQGGGYLGVLSPSNKIVASISSYVLLYPAGIVYNPSNNYMYVAYPTDNAVGAVSSS